MTEEHDIAYGAVVAGTPVHSSDGQQIGTVERVLDIPDLDLFDGIVIVTGAGDRFIDRDQVTRITTHAVYCDVAAADAHALPVPDSPPTFRADATQDRGGSFVDRLKRQFGRGKWQRDHDDE
jgi:hypothetical protein